MNSGQTTLQEISLSPSGPCGTESTQGSASKRALWFGSLYLGSLSVMVSIGGSMRLLLTYL